MKNIILLFILLISISVTSCGQEQKYNFAKITSQSEINALLKKIQKENIDAKIDTVYKFNEITVKGMHYDGVPVKSALITDHYTLLTTDTLNYSGKHLLETIEAKKGLTKQEETYNSDREFKWKTETEDTEFKLKFINGKHLAAIGDKDYAELTIKYKPVYDKPLANIHREIKTFENQPKYVLKIRAYGCVYDIIINNIVISESNNYSEYYLNNFITNDVSSLKIIAKPSKDVTSDNTFKERAQFSAVIVNTNSDETLQQINETQLKGNGPIEFKLDFLSKLPYYPKAWTDGDDLRNDKNLKPKIIALYEKIGKAVLAKDKQAINDIFYQRGFERQQLGYDTNFETARNEWEAYLTILHNTYKYTLAKDFDIEFNSSGKLIWTKPTKKSSPLIFTGKNYDHSMNYFLYQPKGSNELKVIR